ncbi:MAG TPA: hypothetical protein VN660_01800 [Steroidobacteraceae bacterium]|nr:hypothetical protein [Steroidobacteraceae bacterium]
MELMLQCGWGMMEHCEVLVRHWGGGTVILSPRDTSAQQMSKLSSKISAASGAVMLDPQLYVPGCRHPRLTAHAFWPRLPEYWRDISELSRVIDELLAANAAYGTSHIISPSPCVSVVSDDALQPVTAAIEELGRRGVDPARILATVALNSEAARNEDRAETLSDAIEGWEVGGIYLVAGHPNDEYLVDDPMWVARVLDIIAGARLAGKAVVVGYAAHQMLIAAAAGANAIASGTWLNVRRFSPTKFDTSDDDDIRRHATWYYAPRALSEFKVPYLDIAWRHQQLQALQAPPDMDGSFASRLFSGAQPTTVDFGEPDAFRHYLQCLRQQVASARQPTFRETAQDHENLLSEAETGLTSLRKAGIVSQERGFLEAAAANRAALMLLSATRGPILEREWSSL